MTKKQAIFWGASHPIGTLVRVNCKGFPLPVARVESEPCLIAGEWVVYLEGHKGLWGIDFLEDVVNPHTLQQRLFQKTESSRRKLLEVCLDSWNALKPIVLNRMELKADEGNGNMYVDPSSQEWGTHRIHEDFFRKHNVHIPTWWETIRSTPEFEGMTVLVSAYPCFIVFWEDQPPKFVTPRGDSESLPKPIECESSSNWVRFRDKALADSIPSDAPCEFCGRRRGSQ